MYLAEIVFDAPNRPPIQLISLPTAAEHRFSDQVSVYGRSQIAGSSQPVTSGARPTVFLSVPEEMRASIASYRNRFNKYLRDTSTHEQGQFDPWGLVNR